MVSTIEKYLNKRHIADALVIAEVGIKKIE